MANLRKKSEYEIKDSKGGVFRSIRLLVNKDIVTFIGVGDIANQPLVGQGYNKDTLQFTGFDGKTYHVVRALVELPLTIQLPARHQQSPAWLKRIRRCQLASNS